MAETIYIVGSQSLVDIADAIREKNPDVQGGITVAEMPQKIRDIPTGGGGESPYTKTELPIYNEPVITGEQDWKDRYYYMEVSFYNPDTGDTDIDFVLVHEPSGRYRTSGYFNVTVGYSEDGYSITLSPVGYNEFMNMTVTEFVMNDYLPQDEANFFQYLGELHY